MFSRTGIDFRATIRALRRQPVFTVVVVATLAIGIGANTAVFALIHAALLKPLPYVDPDRLVMARRTLPGRTLRNNSTPDYYDYREQIAGFERLAAIQSATFMATVTSGGTPERVSTNRLSYDLFSTLGVQPVAGRLFTADEGKAGAPYVAVVSARLAERRFGSAQEAVGKMLSVTVGPRGVAVAIVGVIPSAFRLVGPTDLWIPIRRGENDGPETRRFHNWMLVGRLKAGETIASVQGQADVVSRRLQQQYPETNKVKGLRLDPLQSAMLQAQTPRMMMLMGSVALVLLIACTNVAGMLLARGVARRGELAMRAALGASRARIAGQLITESVFLAGIAGLAGAVLALWLRRVLPAAAGLSTAGVTASALEGPVLLFALVATIVTGVLAGVVPALRASSPSLATQLAPGVRATDSRGGARLRGLLVVSQVALSMLLLVGAGLLVRSLVALTTTDLRFRSDNLLTTAIDIPGADPARRLQILTDLRDDIRAIPGVAAVTFASHTPILEPFGDPPMYPTKRPPTDSSQERTALARAVLPGFFDTLGIRWLSGRDFTDADRIGTQPVLVVNEVFAREFFPDENPIGQRVVMPGDTAVEYEIVGLVEGARTELVSRPIATVYLPMNQRPQMGTKLLVRSTLPPAALTETLRKIVAARNPAAPVDPLVRIDDMVGDSLAPQRVIAFTLTAFSAVALLLAALGLYGLLAQYVSERTHELGVRMALGAEAHRVIASVLWRSARMIGAGLAIGVGTALATTRVLAEFLYGVQPTDPLTFVSVTGLLALVGMAASAWPAWRASRVDPVRALRGE